jgi:hypothetical protein
VCHEQPDEGKKLPSSGKLRGVGVGPRLASSVQDDPHPRLSSTPVFLYMVQAETRWKPPPIRTLLDAAE